ncbi:MAG: helix-turn-helix transcriptional regulator [Clostridia bacterium]|nr:helix-turn-helix transcriptional regulator [Clostridia bacterium]
MEIIRAVIEENKANFNSENVLLIVNEGEIAVTIGGRVFVCGDNTAVLLNADDIVNINTFKNNSKFTAINFKSKGNNANFNNLVFYNSFEKIISEEIRSIIIKNNNNINKLSLLAQLFVLEIENAFSAEFVRLENKSALIFSRSVDLLNKNARGNISVSELSGLLNTPVSTLKRIFFKYAGMGVHEYLTCLKINIAKELLLQGLSIADVAEQTGFNNQNYFSSAFKRQTGVSPKDYAKNNGTTKLVRKSKPKAKHKNDMPSYLL